MTRKDLALRIAHECGVGPSLAHEIVQMLFDEITATLVEEGRTELRNFGVFQVKRRKARQARNPRTGEKVMVPERLVVTFKPRREMEQRVGQLENLSNGRE